MTTTFRTHFDFRVDTWTPDGESIVEHAPAAPARGKRNAPPESRAVPSEGRVGFPGEPSPRNQPR
jgi:hypothetical protein